MLESLIRNDPLFGRCRPPRRTARCRSRQAVGAGSCSSVLPYYRGTAGYHGSSNGMTTSLRGLTRRTFGRICTTALLFGRRCLRAGASVPLTWGAQPDPSTGLERRYRADAQVVLLSIPLRRRQGVGDGSAIWRRPGDAAAESIAGRLARR